MMINALHLLWIIPLVAFATLAIMYTFQINTLKSDYNDITQEINNDNTTQSK